MTYINPFELLNFASENLADANSIWIKRAKKKLFAEIELSESDTILYDNIHITKSDCNRAIDDLDDTEKKEFHYFIFQNKPLNDFLKKGWLGFFTSFKVESIYKLPAFLDFISPFFSEKYDIILAENYKKSNLENVKVIISVRPIVNENYIELCFKSLYIFLRDIDNQFVVINKDIQDNKSEFAATNFNSLLPVLQAKLNIPILNSLPAYFQGIRNQIGSTLRSLSIDIHNEPYEFYEPAFKISEFARSISTDGPVAQNLLKDYVTLKKHYETYVIERQNEELVKKYSVIFTIYRDYINDVEKLTKQIENGISPHLTYEFSSLLLWINKNLNIPDLNALPEIFDKIRQQIALQLRGLSVEIWNKYSYIEPSLRLIVLASTIKVDDETSALLDKDLDNLKAISNKIQNQQKPVANIPITSRNIVRVDYDKRSASHGNIGPLVLLILFIVLVFAIIASQSNHNDATNNNPPTKSYSPDNNSTSAPSSNNSSPLQTNPEPTPAYYYPKMSNGNISGCSRIKSKYDLSLNNKLVISVGNNANAVVKLINHETNRCIRYVFINKNSTYSIRNIPEGRYYVKIAYGDDWGVLQGKPKCLGEFTSNTLFKRGTDILDFNRIENYNGYEIPSYSLKLNVVYSNQYSSDPGDQSFNSITTESSDFYN